MTPWLKFISRGVVEERPDAERLGCPVNGAELTVQRVWRAPDPKHQGGAFWQTGAPKRRLLAVGVGKSSFKKRSNERVCWYSFWNSRTKQYRSQDTRHTLLCASVRFLCLLVRSSELGCLSACLFLRTNNKQLIPFPLISVSNFAILIQHTRRSPSLHSR
jgi:hypothetical protein